MGAQSNAIEYLPISLLMLLVLEFNGAGAWLVHVLGMAMLVGRGFHINGMVTKRLKHRVLGMRITIFGLIALSIVNIVYLPYGKLY